MLGHGSTKLEAQEGWWVRRPAGELTLRSSLLISDVFSDDTDLLIPPPHKVKLKHFIFSRDLPFGPHHT